MDVQHKTYLTPEQYLAIERRAETKSEYLDGEMFAMSGASRNHNLIVVNLAREISSQLRNRPCEAYSTEQRVRILVTGLYTYPDVVVVCGEPQFEDEELDTLLNPTLLIEVLFSSTETYDRGKKFEHYQTLPSLSEYVLVSQTEPRIEQFLRQERNRWLLTTATGIEARIDLPSIQCELALAEVYLKVAFDAGTNGT